MRRWGHLYGSMAIFGSRSPTEAMQLASDHAARALQLDPQSTDARLTLAGVEFYWRWNGGRAEQLLQEAIQRNPDSARAYRMLAEVLSFRGRHEEALAATLRGRTMDPLPPISQLKPALILYLQRKYTDALREAQAGAGRYPEFWQAYWLQCLSASALEQHALAVAACEQASGLSGREPKAHAALAYASARGGDRDKALVALEELQQMQSRRHVNAAYLAVIYGALNQPDEALAALQKGFEERDPELVHMHNSAMFDALSWRPEVRPLVPGWRRKESITGS